MSTPAYPAPATLDAAMAAVRARGLRASTARRLVLAALVNSKGPVTAQEIATGLGGELPSSDLASVYRNLDTLERAELVRHVHAAHGPGRYALADDTEGFLTCERCGAVEPANPRALALIRGAVQKAFGYEASFVHFPIVGVCRGCSE